MSNTLLFSLLIALGGITESPTAIPVEDIKMCAVTADKFSCPIDDPEFTTTDENVYISLSSSEMRVGDQVRFTWYRQNNEIFISDYLASVFETVVETNPVNGQAVVLSNFPKDVELTAGEYEVVIHPANGRKPIIKTFTVK